MRRAAFTLFAIGAITMAQNVGLNHFYVTVDSPTYNSIRTNAFLRQEFAPSEERTTVRADSTYTGLYFYGRKTYFEFFDGGAKSEKKTGDSAIALGVDESGWADRLGERFTPPRTTGKPITRQWNGRQWPWFLRLTPEEPLDAPFKTWLMEYEPEFLSSWRPSLTKSNKGVSRSAILERYADVLPARPPQPWLEDVMSLTVALTPAEAERLRGFAKGLGIAVEGDVLKTADATIRIVPANGSVRGVTRMTVRLKHKPPAERVVKLGPKSLLKLGKDGVGEWSF